MQLSLLYIKFANNGNYLEFEKVIVYLNYPCGRLAQLDRVQASEAWGRGFESHAARQL